MARHDALMALKSLDPQSQSYQAHFSTYFFAKCKNSKFSVPDPWRVDTDLDPRIRTSGLRIWIRGSVPLDYGSGSGS